MTRSGKPVVGLVRPARMSDREPLMKFIRRVWGGHDYIPRVWDDWMADNSAKMFVVEVDGVPVGMNRVKFVQDGTAWFEGVRVHPKFRGLGLATALGNNTMQVARSRGVKKFRLTSSSWNHSAHRQIARMEYKESSRISVYQASERMKFQVHPETRTAERNDLPSVMKMVRGSKEYALGSGVLWDSYTAIGMTNDVIGKRIAEGGVRMLGKAVAVEAPGSEGDDAWTQVCFLSGPDTEAVALVEDAFARSQSATKIAYLPQGSRLIRALRRRGLKRVYSLILFERSALNG